MSYSICDEIRCPFSLKDGCDRYVVAARCHLFVDRKQEPGAAYYDNSGIRATQYWLYADESDPRIDINALREANEKAIAEDEAAQRRLWAYENFGAKERSWETEQCQS